MSIPSGSVAAHGEKVRARASLLLDGVERLLKTRGWIRSPWDWTTSLGRSVLAVAITAWVLGWALGWSELMAVASGALLLAILAAVFIVGGSPLRTSITLAPNRVVAGTPAAGQVSVTNPSSRRTLATRVELPVGDGLALFDLPSLAAGTTAEELFVVPTERRGVIPIGPATTVRADPVGLFHRIVASSESHELIVHPKSVMLAPFGSGLLRDLEGLTSADLSASDLAFHALRPYAPGDDRRYIHWRSSAKAQTLLVRQFQETRRSTLCAVVDGERRGYSDPSEFELALEIAASVALRACRDELAATVLAGGQAAVGSIPHLHLDALSRATLDGATADLATQARRAVSLSSDVSFAIIVSGSATTTETMHRAARRFPQEVRVLAIRVVPGEPPAIGSNGQVVAAELGTLSDLPALLRTEAAT